MSALRERLGLLRDRRGFTMVEMMVVLIIIAVLIGVGIKFYLGYIENSRVTKAKSQIQTMQAALDSYYAQNGAYPNKDQATQLINAGLKPKSGTTDGTLDATDPWGKNYMYVSDKTGTTDTSTKYYVRTGHDDVQGQKSGDTLSCVFGRGSAGTSESPIVGNPAL